MSNYEFKASRRDKSIVLRYPCDDSSSCSPYELTLNPGVYKMECWGSMGQQWAGLSHPGFGAYTKGTILISKKTTMYVYVGARGFFNAVRDTVNAPSGYSGGGATDVRLTKGSTWYEMSSLISRIMVAAGGAGAEWEHSYGGNGGTTVGGNGFSYNVCEGATQTSGTTCPPSTSSNTYYASTGEFGSAGFVASTVDYGAFGGGGYYGGSSYPYGFAGSGGSSFISGYEGCNAVKNELPVKHTGSPIHYSGLVFSYGEMIGGNETMPLPQGGKGIYDNANGGAFRITIVTYGITCRCKNRSPLSLLCFMILSICS